MRMYDIIAAKRDGKELDYEALKPLSSDIVMAVSLIIRPVPFSWLCF